MSAVLLAAAAVILNVGAGYAAFQRRSVTGSGAVAGAVVGTLIFIGGGPGYWLMLMLFFVGSSLAGRVGSRRRPSLERMHERGSRRDYVQVFANGGVAAIAALLLRMTGHLAFATATAAALAAATADTWASELGVLSSRPPRSILTWRRLEAGTSGGVSWLGTAAAAAGSILIAASFAAVEPRITLLPALAIILPAGLLGTTADSLLGATVQAQYRDDTGRPTERRAGEQSPNTRTRGAAFVNNDVVNAASTLVAAVAAALVAFSGRLP